MVLPHIVALRFQEDISEERIKEHLKRSIHSFRISETGAHHLQYVVIVLLADERALAKYISHAEHAQVKEIQAALLGDISLVVTIVSH